MSQSFWSGEVRFFGALAGAAMVGAAAFSLLAVDVANAQLRDADPICIPSPAIQTILLADAATGDAITVAVPLVESVGEYAALPDGTRVTGALVTLSSGRVIYAPESEFEMIGRLAMEGWQ